MEWYLNKESTDKYLIFTLDSGETWEDKADDIAETIRKWRERHIEDHA